MLPLGLGCLPDEREQLWKAVKHLMQVHSLSKPVAEASVYVAGWWDVDLCLKWARHYGKDSSLVKINADKFLSAMLMGQTAPVNGDGLRSTCSQQVLPKQDETHQGAGKIDQKTSRLESLLISELIKDLLLQFDADCDALESLEVKYCAMHNLVNFFGMSEHEAMAAVQETGTELDKWRSWAVEERSVDDVRELVSEYHTEREIFFHLRSKMSHVDMLIEEVDIQEDLIKAAVQSTGCLDVKELEQWVKDLKRRAQNFTCAIDKLVKSDCPAHVASLAAKFDSDDLNVVYFQKTYGAVAHLINVHGIDASVAAAAVQSEGFESLDLQLRWISVNEFNAGLVRDLYGEYLLQRCFFKEFNTIEDIRIKYGLDEMYSKAFFKSPVKVKSVENFLAWTCGNADSIFSTDFTEPLEELESNFDKGASLLRKLELKENAVSLLGKKYSVEVAKAAVQMCGPYEADCQHWIERHQQDHKTLKFSLREYEMEHESYDILKKREMAMMLLVQKHRFDKKLAKAAVQLKGPDIAECKEWINAVLERKASRRRTKSEKHDMVRFLVENFTLTWIVASAAVQRCGHENFEKCLEWINSKQHLVQEVGEASWEYRFWQSRDELAFDKPDLMFIDTKNPASTALEVTLSLLMEIYHFSPILAQAAISSEGWGLSNVQKCKEWAETNREEYKLIAAQCNCLEEKIQKEVEKQFREKTVEKAIAKKRIGKEGGNVGLLGCTAEFIPGAVDVDKGVEFEVSVSNNPENYPKNCFPVTPIFGCKPRMEFQKPVKIKMRTYYSASGNCRIPGKVLCKKHTDDPWDEIENVTICDGIYICFEVQHFCGYVVGISSENASLGEHHFMNDVYIQRGTAQIVSVFTRDEKVQLDLRSSLRDQGFAQFLPVTHEINERLGVQVRLQLECDAPNGTDIGEGRPSSSFVISRDFLKLTQYPIYFKMNPRPGCENQVIDIAYNVELGGRRVQLALTTCWPIHLPDRTQTINIGSNTGTVNTAPVSHTANQLATGNAKVEVFDSTSVITRDESSDAE